MKINVSYEDIMKDYPEQAEEIISKIRKGKGKNKDIHPSLYVWEITTAEISQAYTLHEVINGVEKHQKPLEERLLVCLMATVGRSYASKLLATVPDIVMSRYMMLKLSK